jgi:DNA-binding transcriptional LysR family regulator
MHILHYFQYEMHIMHDALRRVDLNLLVVFDALYRHRSVSKAAEELSLSPSAFSHALTRLRDSLSDSLFVRVGNTMQPTMRAENIAHTVGDVLTKLSGCLPVATPFDPAQSRHSFIFAATDYTAFVLMPLFIARLLQQAPGLHIKVVPANGNNSHEDLVAGRIDFALGFADEFASPSDAVESIECLTEDYVVAARNNHPSLHDSLSLRQYLDARHIVVRPWGESEGVIDKALGRQGYRRDIAVELTSLMAAPFVVGSSDLLITLPHHAALTLRKAADVKLFTAPFATPRNVLKVLLKAKYPRTGAHAWLKEQIVLALRNDSVALDHAQRRGPGYAPPGTTR